MIIGKKYMGYYISLFHCIYHWISFLHNGSCVTVNNIYIFICIYHLAGSPMKHFFLIVHYNYFIAYVIKCI